MTETLNLILAFLMGAGAGALFFGGLWWTVMKGVTAKQPGSLFLGSFLLRTMAALLILSFFMHRRLAELALCLFGFVAVKVFFLAVPGRLP